MVDIKNITLAFNCPESRESLNSCGRDYFCEKCRHKVLDFTTSSEEELLKSLKASNTPVCGIFRRSQLSKPLLKYLAVSVTAIAASVVQVSAQEISEIEEIPVEETGYEPVVFGMVVETMPLPEGGHEKFYEAIASEIRYPKRLHMEDKVYVQFMIDTLGNMTNGELVKGLHEVADAEALRVLKAINYKFIPATQSGVKVQSRMIVPISFGRIKE
ncbi:energy transducer TonB [Fulvivirga ulvae]|uniref:energy transducer TonB n=1 Tax=Fulvivirga ulvae TaxID=2904245 RepID=UPI001F3C1615|nr:energy transducer TonB [Fulvivirga ulvae]UII32304.1 energy transducer TonB [Fulvivirga ulvae]